MLPHRASIDAIEHCRALLAPLFGVRFFSRPNPRADARGSPDRVPVWIVHRPWGAGEPMACTPIRGATSHCPRCDSGFSLTDRSNDRAEKFRNDSTT